MRKTLLLIIAVLILGQLVPAQDVPFQATHRGSIYKVQFSPDGTKLVSYSSGNQDLGLWDVPSGRLIWKRPISFIQKADEYYTLFAFAWSPDQKFIATGSGNGTVQLWDAATGNFLWRADAHKKDVTALKFSPDGKTIASAALSGKNDSVKLIRTADGSLVKSFEGDPCTGVAIAFDPSGTKFRIGNLDGNITEWDIGPGKQVNPEAARCGVRRTYDWEGSFDDDLKISAGKINFDEVVIKDIPAGKTLKTAKANDSKIRTTVSGNGRKAVISEYGGFRYYNTETLEERLLDDCISGDAIDLNNDGSLFAQSCDGGMTAIKITDMKEGRSWFLDGHPGNIYGISYSPDGKILAVAGGDGNIYFFDPGSRALLKTLRGNNQGITAIAFSPDMKVLVSGDASGGIAIWDVASGKLLNESPRAGERIYTIENLEFTRDGKLFSVLFNGSLSIWEIETLKPRGEILTREGYESSSGSMTLGYTNVPVTSAVFAGDGKTIFSGHRDGTIRSWNVGTLEQLSRFKAAEGVSFVTRVPSANKIVVLAKNKDKYRFELIDLKTMKVHARSRNIDGGYMRKVSVSPDGKYLAAVDLIGRTDIWNLADLSFLRDLGYRSSGDDSVAFSPDGKTFFIGGDNQNLLRYDTVTGKKLWQLLPSFQPGELEQKLDAESDVRLAKLKEITTRRNKQAALDVAKYRAKVYLTFEHYGDMSDPGEKKMMESDQPKESKAVKAAGESNAVWLRLHNDSPLPVQIPTESMYMRAGECFHLFSNGEKMNGLCDNREISVWFGVKDRAGKYVPYGFDFGSSAVLLPGTSVLFPVPLSILQKGNSVVFGYSFQNVKASESDDDWDYGKEIELKFGMQNIPVKLRQIVRP